METLKAILFIISMLFFSHYGFSQSTFICDDNMIRLDIGKQPTGTHIDEEIEKQVEKNRSNTQCDLVYFWLSTDTNGKKNFTFATPIGNPIEVKDLRVQKDAHVIVQAIEYPPGTGKIEYVCSSQSGEYCFIKSFLLDLISAPENWCRGLPIGPTKKIRCSSCRKFYYQTEFMEPNGEVTSIISNGRTCTLGNGIHDDLDLVPLGDCSCYDSKSNEDFN